MKITLNEDKLSAFKHRLETSEDAESLGTGEYALDLYDEDPPLSLELALMPDGVDILAAAELQYDESSSGYFLGERRYDSGNIEKILLDWIG